MATFLSLSERCRQDVRFFPASRECGSSLVIGYTTKSRQDLASPTAFWTFQTLVMSNMNDQNEHSSLFYTV
jgi:hypothetical protein